MTRPCATWLLLLVATYLIAGCGPAEPPRMKDGPAVKPGSVEVKDKLPKGAGKPGMEKKVAR
jgi:hypothetical protein